METKYWSGYYDYLEEMVNDIEDEINNGYYDDILEDVRDDRDAFYEVLNDALWDADSITGNGYGGGYCNAVEAEKYLAGNRELLANALEEFGADAESYRKAIVNPVYADATIRCYLLGEAIDKAIDRNADRWLNSEDE